MTKRHYAEFIVLYSEIMSNDEVIIISFRRQIILKNKLKKDIKIKEFIKFEKQN